MKFFEENLKFFHGKFRKESNSLLYAQKCTTCIDFHDFYTHVSNIVWIALIFFIDRKDSTVILFKSMFDISLWIFFQAAQLFQVNTTSSSSTIPHQSLKSRSG